MNEYKKVMEVEVPSLKEMLNLKCDANIMTSAEQH